VTIVTVVYMGIYYAFMVHQLCGKKYQGSANSAEYELGRMTDRTFLNTLEQQAPFLILLWLHALLVDPAVSHVLGWVAVIARLFFPILWSLDGTWNWKVELSTQPYYLVLNYFMFALFCKAIWNVNLYDQVPGWAFPFVVVGGFLLMFGLSAALGFLLYQINKVHFKIPPEKESSSTIDSEDYGSAMNNQ